VTEVDENVAWAMFWFGYEALVFTAAIFAGIIVFRVSFSIFMKTLFAPS
jgi:hypothetical protein